MAELYPMSFPLLLKRALSEFEKNKTIFDLPERSFFKPSKELSTQVSFCGREAATPLGPASGPHTQLAQNIVLAWLGGARIMELKTVQILDRLKIARPCIDVRNIGHNVEWSQELRLEESLREYVAAHILIEILTAANVLEVDPGPTIFDISVGYDLAGITTKKVRNWLSSMRDASKLVEQFVEQIPSEYSEFRKFPFKTNLSGSITLSTFHGCPANEIEQIVEFLISEMDFDVIIKMNPPMLGKEKLEGILHEQLGYAKVKVNPKAYESGISFDEGVEIVKRLQKTARERNRFVGVKFSNTLEVINQNEFFEDEIMYLSGEPLHVLAMTLVHEWRKVFGTEVPISFAAGITQHNFADAVSCGLVPVTTCTDLLRPGGYGRLTKYMGNLHKKMDQVEAKNIDQFILASNGNAVDSAKLVLDKVEDHLFQNGLDLNPKLKKNIENFLGKIDAEWKEQIKGKNSAGEKDYHVALYQFLDSIPELETKQKDQIKDKLQPLFRDWVQTTAVLNTNSVLQKTYEDPRYRHEKNVKTPRKIGSHLEIFDCINCDKCIPVCPNDANFSYEIEPLEMKYSLFRIKDQEVVEEPGGKFTISASHQIANFSDFCNDCGNCDIFCPEDGGPFIEKPRFFGSAESFNRHDNLDGFYIYRQNDLIHALARIVGKTYTYIYDPINNRSRFTDDIIEIECDSETHEVLQKIALVGNGESHVLDFRTYLTSAKIVKGVLSAEQVNYVNSGIAT